MLCTLIDLMSSLCQGLGYHRVVFNIPHTAPEQVLLMALESSTEKSCYFSARMICTYSSSLCYHPAREFFPRQRAKVGSDAHKQKRDLLPFPAVFLGVWLPIPAASPFLGSSVHPHMPKAGISRAHHQPAAPGQQRFCCCLTRGAEATSLPAEAPGTAGAGGQRRWDPHGRNWVLAQPPGLGDFAPLWSVQPMLGTTDGYGGFPEQLRERRPSPPGHRAKTPPGTGRKKKIAQMGRHRDGKL